MTTYFIYITYSLIPSKAASFTWLPLSVFSPCYKTTHNTPCHEKVWNMAIHHELSQLGLVLKYTEKIDKKTCKADLTLEPLAAGTKVHHVQKYL